MEPREATLLHARARIAVGAAFVLLPGLAGRMWIGSPASWRPVKVLARAFGARDLAIGLGIVIALDRGTPVRGWIEAGMLSDAIDTCASVLAGNSIPAAIRWPAIAVGAGSTAIGAQLAQEWDHAGGSDQRSEGSDQRSEGSDQRSEGSDQRSDPSSPA